MPKTIIRDGRNRAGRQTWRDTVTRKSWIEGGPDPLRDADRLVRAAITAWDQAATLPPQPPMPPCKSAHAHFWAIGWSAEPVVSGRCDRCGAERLFQNHLPDESFAEDQRNHPAVG